MGGCCASVARPLHIQALTDSLEFVQPRSLGGSIYLHRCAGRLSISSTSECQCSAFQITSVHERSAPIPPFMRLLYTAGFLGSTRYRSPTQASIRGHPSCANMFRARTSRHYQGKPGNHMPCMGADRHEDSRYVLPCVTQHRLSRYILPGALQCGPPPEFCDEFRAMNS